MSQNNSDQWFHNLVEAIKQDSFDKDNKLIFDKGEEFLSEEEKTFQERIKKNKNRAEVIRNTAYKARRVNNLFLGTVVSFYYPEPVTESKLPYWDEMPMSVIIKKYKGSSAGFLGMNLNYIPKKQRLQLLTQISGNRRSRKKGMGTIATLYKHPKYKFLFKRYLYSQLRSRVVSIPETDWMKVAELPVRWRKKTHHAVTADYRRFKG